MFEPEQLLNPPENRPTDSKREEFRKYLENSGVLDALTKVLVELYEEPEKPSNAVNFVKQHIGGVEAVDAKSEYISNLEARIKDLESEVYDLKIKLDKEERKEENNQNSNEENAD
ncbi:c-Myc-binding protein homolog isoform X2 [Hydra vulgaris]|uniref:c-Myc-binding protein homolog isoform X1 n=1 Tax=Hydra vulgaris TaxID=6087 RepID=A0ABM4BVT8_HYDVU